MIEKVLELIKVILEKGITWTGIISVLIILNKIYTEFQNKRYKQATSKETHEIWEVVVGKGSYISTGNSSLIPLQAVGLSAQVAERPTAPALTLNIRGFTMLKKMDSRKLQMVLVATIINLCLLVGYVFDVQDIQSKVDAWTPLINLGVQTVLGLGYAYIEGKIDAARAQNGGFEDGKNLDSVARDSLDS